MAEGNEPNPNQVYHDYVTFNLNELLLETGSFTKTMTSSHPNQYLVGYSLSCGGVSDISYFTITPVLVSDNTIYITYQNSNIAVTRNRNVTLRLLFMNS